MNLYPVSESTELPQYPVITNSSTEDIETHSTVNVESGDSHTDYQGQGSNSLNYETETLQIVYQKNQQQYKDGDSTNIN